MWWNNVLVVAGFDLVRVAHEKNNRPVSGRIHRRRIERVSSAVLNPARMALLYGVHQCFAKRGRESYFFRRSRPSPYRTELAYRWRQVKDAATPAGNTGDFARQRDILTDIAAIKLRLGCTTSATSVPTMAITRSPRTARSAAANTVRPRRRISRMLPQRTASWENSSMTFRTCRCRLLSWKTACMRR